jgi:hypothetical protein
MSFQLLVFSKENDTIVDHIFTLIYNQEFDFAENVLSEQTGKLDAYYYSILRLDLFWWKFSMSGSKDDFAKLTNVLESLNSSGLVSTKEKIIYLIQSSYKFRYEVSRYNFIGAIILRSDIRKQITELKKEKLSFNKERLKLFDLYLSLFQYSDNSINPFLINTKSQECLNSLSALEKYSHEDDLIVSTLAHYFLGRIYTKVEKKPEKGQVHFKILAQRFPKNSLFKELSEGLNPRF